MPFRALETTPQNAVQGLEEHTRQLGCNKFLDWVPEVYREQVFLIFAAVFDLMTLVFDRHLFVGSRWLFTDREFALVL